MKIELKKKMIPRDDVGDPAFVCLGPLVHPREYTECPVCHVKGDHQINTVINQFTPEEIVHMVNRYVYFVESQQAAHSKRAARQRAALHAVRKKVRAMFGVSYDNATPEQQAAAVRALGREEGPPAGR